MAIVISVSSTIGGSCKTTVACLLAHSLSISYKVLAIDLCAQYHMSEVFLDDRNNIDLSGTIYDAFVIGDIASFVIPITNNLNVLPGDQCIVTVPREFYVKGYSAEEIVISLRVYLNQIKSDYDFIVIDTPNTSDELFSLSLSIADFAIMTFSPNRISLIAKWLRRVDFVKNSLNPKLVIGGVLKTRFNDIEALHKYDSQEVFRQYPKHCWNSSFPNSPLYANIDFQTLQKEKVSTAFKPVYNELILRLLTMRNGGVENGESTSQAQYVFEI